MLITIRELMVRPVDFDEKFAPGSIDLGTEVRQASALETQGRATLVEEHQAGRAVIRDVRLVGGFATRVELRCARCLEPVFRDLKADFDLLYRPAGTVEGHEVSIREADTEIGFFKGEGVELEDVLREQVLLAVPVKAVCREDCRGLCPHCGKNLNAEACQCHPEEQDPRWEGLREIRDRLK